MYRLLVVGIPTSIGHGPIEVNIYKGTFLPLHGLLVGDERGSNKKKKKKKEKRKKRVQPNTGPMKEIK